MKKAVTIVAALMLFFAISPVCKAEPDGGGGLDRCPVCGKLVYKEPEIAAFIYYEKNGKIRYLAFDGVADMMKFYFEPNRWGDFGNIKMHILKMVVRGHSTKKPLWAKRAWYVYLVETDTEGSANVRLVPFKSRESARKFMRESGAEALLSFKEITKEILYPEKKKERE